MRSKEEAHRTIVFDDKISRGNNSEENFVGVSEDNQTDYGKHDGSSPEMITFLADIFNYGCLKDKNTESEAMGEFLNVVLEGSNLINCSILKKVMLKFYKMSQMHIMATFALLNRQNCKVRWYN